MNPAMSTSAELLLDARADLGEGALWEPRRQALLWVDILAGNVHLFDPKTGQDRSINVGQPVGTVVHRKKGGAMVALRDGLGALDLESGKLTMVANTEAEIPTNRFNDGKCDPAGRFWAGTMPFDGKNAAGKLYCLYPDMTVKVMLDQVAISNGIVWTADAKTMYFIDSATYRVDAFDYDKSTGAIKNRRTAFEFPKELGFPDGSTLDEEGMLWVAQFGSGTVNRWDPRTGKLLQRINVPSPMATSCAFGGPQLDQLYITSSRLAMDEATLKRYPQAGGIYVVEPGVRGVLSQEFSG